MVNMFIVRLRCAQTVQPPFLPRRHHRQAANPYFLYGAGFRSSIADGNDLDHGSVAVVQRPLTDRTHQFLGPLEA